MFTELTVIIMMKESQVIMLYTLNLYSAVCQLYLTKTERKMLNSKKKKKEEEIFLSKKIRNKIMKITQIQLFPFKTTYFNFR